MAGPEMVAIIRSLSSQLARIVTLLPADDPFDTPGPAKPAPSFLFEMKVLMALLIALRDRGWTVEVVRRGTRIRFVRAPALKATASYFIIQKDGLGFQLTQGTRVVDVYGKPRAPDIALQRAGATEMPTHSDVRAIWDAKLRGTTGRVCDERITDHEFRDFLVVRKWLDAPQVGDDDLADFPAAFSVCSLISNGLGPTEPEAVFLDHGVSVVEQFDGGDSPSRPTREQHHLARRS